MLGRRRDISIRRCFRFLGMRCGLRGLTLVMVCHLSSNHISHGLLTLPDVSTNILNVPFKHFSIRLPNHADTKTAYEAYLRLLELSRETLARLGEGSRDYNVAMTADWITVIPRRSSEGPYGANAAGMLGIVYLPDQQERDRWAQVGYTKQLEAFGIPVDA